MTSSPLQPTASETARVRRLWQKMAARYDRQIQFLEKALFARGREWIGDEAEGDVLEIAIGTGRNIPYYRTDVRLTGVDISEAMLRIAAERATRSGRHAALLLGDAQALAFADESFDTVVFALALCSVPNHRRAITEARRVLRPGGRIVLLEHVRSPIRLVALIQSLLDLLTVSLAGDHLVREPLDQITKEGFLIETVERSKLGIVERASARKPANPR